MAVYYFDSRGRWIAIRDRETDKNFFSPRAEWIGWLAWDDQDVCGVSTKSYLGTLVGDRLLKKVSAPPRLTPVAPFGPPRSFYPLRTVHEACDQHARRLHGCVPVVAGGWVSLHGGVSRWGHRRMGHARQ